MVSLSARNNRPIRLWIACVAALTILTVMVGGATRLTQSGLSIVEWRPVTGTLPPLSQSAWQAEFAKYKTIPQYEIVNRGMSLDEFKTIYWWEWGHRNLARAIGVVFLLPFLWFLWRGWIGAGLGTALAGVFVLGGIQAGVGWWMVSSGLSDRIHVSHYRLAFHLTLACAIYAALVWIAARLGARGAVAVPIRLKAQAIGLVLLVLVQVYSGALVAGLHAGLVYGTWPLIEGRLIPPASDLFFAHPIWMNFFENTLTVQFVHRTIAYLLVAASLVHALDALVSAPGGGGVRGGALALAAAVLLQATLGVLTLLKQVPIDLALTHQFGAMVVLTVAVVQAERTTRRGRVAVRDPDPVLAVR